MSDQLREGETVWLDGRKQRIIAETDGPSGWGETEDVRSVRLTKPDTNEWGEWFDIYRVNRLSILERIAIIEERLKL